MIYQPKSEPTPGCLENEKKKARGNYNCEGVLKRLRDDFKNKCYLCEDKEPHSINTEHFQPHKGDKELKFDWKNLFYCCAHCNNTKLANPKYDDILNCTVITDEVDRKIKYHLNPFPKEKPEIIPLEDDDKVLNTVDLLSKIYNGTTELKKIESANLRSKLLKEIRKFQDFLFEYYDDNYTEQERLLLKNKIVRELRSTSSFTAFKLWILRSNEELSVDFEEFI